MPQIYKKVKRIRNAHEKEARKSEPLFLWALTDSNRRPSACKADALNQLS